MRAHAERGGADTGGQCERPTRRPVPAQAGGGESAEAERALKNREAVLKASEASFQTAKRSKRAQASFPAGEAARRRCCASTA